MRTYLFHMAGAQGDASLSILALWTAAQATIRAQRPG
jgi:hypothetical protein